MRIFYAAYPSPISSISSKLWRDNLYQPLVDMGFDVVEFDYDLKETFSHLGDENFIAKNRKTVSIELLRQIKAARVKKPLDLFFSYFYDACVLPEAIDEIRSMGIVTVNWYCNASYQLHLVTEISPRYDWCLVPEKFRMDDYNAMGARPIYCQEAANPNIYIPYDLPVEYDVTFVGQCYGERPGYIKYLLDRGIDVRVWGPGWRNYSPAVRNANRTNPVKRAYSLVRYLATPAGRVDAAGWLKAKLCAERGVALNPTCKTGLNAYIENVSELPDHILGGSLTDLEMIQMYSRSKINLGFSSCGNTHETGERILQVRLRDFEVPMSGGFYMVEYMEELEEFYNVGKEIVCYEGPEDLVDKIRYYLAHDRERETIRRAGYERCRRDHTWHNRFKEAFKMMGLDRANRAEEG